MNATELATLIGTVLGAGAASFGAAWWTMQRKFQTMGQDAPQPQAQLPTGQGSRTISGQIRAARVDDDRRFQRIEEDIAKLEQRMDQQQEQIGRCQTVEEFQAYTTFTTSAMHQLTEKVGEVRGHLMAIKKGGR